MLPISASCVGHSQNSQILASQPTSVTYDAKTVKQKLNYLTEKYVLKTLIIIIKALSFIGNHSFKYTDKTVFGSVVPREKYSDR